MTRLPSLFSAARALAAIAFVFSFCAVAQARVAPATSLRASEKNVPTEIDHVVVYQQGAQVERVADVSVGSGVTELVFTKLNTSIDPNQLRVTGNGNFTVLSISHRYATDTLSGAESAAERGRLQQEQNALSQRINEINTQRVLFDREEQLLLNNQSFTVKDSGVDLDRLMRANTFFRERFLAIHEGRKAIDEDVKKIQADINDLQAQMNALPAFRTETWLEVLVRVEAEAPADGKMLLSYWMQNAGWTPSYNARVADIEDPLKLEYQAMVRQSTGEDWDDVGMSIATGTPSSNRSKPNLTPIKLDGAYIGKGMQGSVANAWLKSQPYNPNIREVRGQLYDDRGNPLIGAQVRANNGAYTTTDINGFYTMAVPQNVSNLSYSYTGMTPETINISQPVMNVALASSAQVLESVEIAMYDEDVAEESLFGGRAERRREEFNESQAGAMAYAAVEIGYSPTSTRFDVSSKYDIPADNQPHAVRILSHDLDVEYLYQATPKLDPQVYLTALFTDWEELDLLDGRMHIYFEDDYVGESQLQLDFVEDTLAISLGPDPGIQVRRKRTLREDRTSLISGKREYQREYEFKVTNRKRSAIHIQIDDQLPIADNEDIEINATKLEGAEVDDETGQILWDLEIPAGKSKTWELRYEVKAPKELGIRVE